MGALWAAQRTRLGPYCRGRSQGVSGGIRSFHFTRARASHVALVSPTQKERTPLHFAAWHGKLGGGVVEALISRGADVTARNKARRGCTNCWLSAPAHAAKHGTGLALAHHKARAPRGPQFGDTPLHFCGLTCGGGPEGPLALLAAGADCDAVQTVRDQTIPSPHLSSPHLEHVDKEYPVGPAVGSHKYHTDPCGLFPAEERTDAASQRCDVR